MFGSTSRPRAGRPLHPEMDNQTLTRRSSTYEVCAHVPLICGWRCIGGWWCVDDGGGVCGQSSQACFHAASVEMDNLTLARRSSTYEACARVPPICIPPLPTPMALVPKNTKTKSTINTKHNHHKHASAEDAPRAQQTLLDTTQASRNHPRANTKEKYRTR